MIHGSSLDCLANIVQIWFPAGEVGMLVTDSTLDEAPLRRPARGVGLGGSGC